MTYRVVFTDRFTQDVDQHIDYLLSERVATLTINRWYGKLYAYLETLEQSPRRFPVDAIMSKHAGHTTRKLSFGNYIAFYQVDDEAMQVTLVAFMHGAKRHES